MPLPFDIMQQKKQQLAGTAADLGMLINALKQLDEFDVVTDNDCVDLLTARVTIMGLLIKNFLQSDETQSLLEDCTAWAQLLTAFADPASLLQKAKQIVYTLHASLAKGGSPKEPVAKALQDMGALPFSNSAFDGNILLAGIVQINALSAAGEYLQLQDQLEANETTNLLKTITSHLLENGFDKTYMLQAYQKAVDSDGVLAGNEEHQVQAVFIIYGLGLLVKPNGAPAMIAMEKYLITRKGLTAAQFLQPATVAKTEDVSEAPAAVMVARYQALVEKDGFTDYALYEAMAALKAIPTDSDEAYDAFNRAMNMLLDTADEYAPPNYREMFSLLRTNLNEMAEWVRNPPPTLSLLQVNEIISNSLADLKQHLEAGELPDISIMRYTLVYNKIALQLPEGEEAKKIVDVLLKSMMGDGLKMLKPYIPADKKELWPQMEAMLDITVDVIDQIDEASELQKMKMMRRFEEHQHRVMQAAVNIPLPPGTNPIIKQFIQLQPLMMDRFVQLQLDSNSGDQTEYKRLIVQVDDTFNLLKSAYTLDQVLEHQQANLRRMALELAQFERRELLLATSPVFPANDIPFDANKIFFAGSSKIAAVLQQACDRLWMHIAQSNTTDNYVNNRWQQLRESGIAVFDYSNFNPAVADPMGALPATEEAEILKAGGAIADIAYEHGWCYVLGKPVITVTKKYRPLPFDMDTDPVVTDNNADDTDKLIFAIQKTLYGISRATRGSNLVETIEYVQAHFADSRNKKITTMLQELTNATDATDIRFSIEAVFDRNRGENRLLVIPAFPGGYPHAVKRTLFHVTAFRSWSVATQAAVESACKENKVEYIIGYERLDPNILASIFDDMSRASFVIADITNLNPNAMLELAIAQALGRPTLIITQNKMPHTYCRSISQARVHHYDPINAKSELLSLLNDFFAGKE